MSDLPAPAAAPNQQPIVPRGQAPASPGAIARTLDHAQSTNPDLHRELARQYQARGYQLPARHSAALAPTTGEPSISALDASPALPWRDAVAYADDLVRGGMDPARVQAAMHGDGHTDYEPDTRTPDQRAHDDRYGVQPWVDPAQYQGFSWGDAGKALPPGQLAEADAGFRGALADMGYSVQSGNSLMTTLVKQGEAYGRLTAEQRGELHQTWAKQLAAVFPTKEGMAEAQAHAKLALGLIDTGNKTFADLEPTGLLKNPNIFVSLANRGASIRAWRDNRPR